MCDLFRTLLTDRLSSTSANPPPLYHHTATVSLAHPPLPPQRSPRLDLSQLPVVFASFCPSRSRQPFNSTFFLSPTVHCVPLSCCTITEQNPAGPFFVTHLLQTSILHLPRDWSICATLCHPCLALRSCSCLCKHAYLTRSTCYFSASVT